MEELPLSGLLPGDPENRLSEQARRRVARARIECNRIQWEAIATAQARHLSDEKTSYLTNQADLKGARLALKVLAAEFVDAGLNLKEFWAAMREEIESVSNSFSLHDAQRRLLEAEFLTPPEQKNHAPSLSPATVPRPAKAEESVVEPKPAPVASPRETIPTTNRERIDRFVLRMAQAGTKLKRKDIWLVAGYTDRTEFERFQRGDNRNRSAAYTFNRVLGLEPQDFLEVLKRKRS